MQIANSYLTMVYMQSRTDVFCLVKTLHWLHAAKLDQVNTAYNAESI